MAGRPRKVVNMQNAKMGKKEKLERKVKEEKLKLDNDDLISPPLFLNKKGQEEYLRVVKEAEKIDMLDNLDKSILAVYANAYANYIEVTEKIQTEGFTITRETRNDTYKAINPLVNIQEKYVKQIMQCSSKLGLAVTDRLKLVVPTAEEAPTNKYLKFLGS